MTQEQALAGEILRIRTGSHLYGTATEDSDEDFAGVFLPDEAHCFGMDRVENVDLSVESKGPDGRNTGEAVDCTYYEIRKFAKLAIQCNPNIIELLFADEDNVVRSTEEGRRLLEARYLFPYQGAYKRFIGYARSQQKKMVIRTESYGHLQEAAETIRALADNTETEWLRMNDLRYRRSEFDVQGVTFNDSYAKVGDLNFMYHLKVGKVASRIEARLAKATARTGLMDRYGYDTKFASHLIRLLHECITLLTVGELQFPLPTADHLLDIRNGGRSMEKVIAESDRLITEIERIIDEGLSPLPKKPRYQQVNGLVIDIVRSRFDAAYLM